MDASPLLTLFVLFVFVLPLILGWISLGRRSFVKKATPQSLQELPIFDRIIQRALPEPRSEDIMLFALMIVSIYLILVLLSQGNLKNRLVDDITRVRTRVKTVMTTPAILTPEAPLQTANKAPASLDSLSIQPEALSALGLTLAELKTTDGMQYIVMPAERFSYWKKQWGNAPTSVLALSKQQNLFVTTDLEAHLNAFEVDLPFFLLKIFAQAGVFSLLGGLGLYGFYMMFARSLLQRRRLVLSEILKRAELEKQPHAMANPDSGFKRFLRGSSNLYRCQMENGFRISIPYEPRNEGQGEIFGRLIRIHPRLVDCIFISEEDLQEWIEFKSASEYSHSDGAVAA